VNSFTQALHVELAPVGVHVTCVTPGYTRTEFQERADHDASSVPDFMWQTADEVARFALESLEKNKALVVPGAQNKAIVGALRYLPLWLQRRIASAGSD
jgi:short-subunit dehydrogenase